MASLKESMEQWLAAHSLTEDKYDLAPVAADIKESRQPCPQPSYAPPTLRMLPGQGN